MTNSHHPTNLSDYTLLISPNQRFKPSQRILSSYYCIISHHVSRIFHHFTPRFSDYSGIYDVATVAAKQAAIVAALYSARLTMIVTVYTNEIVFWDSDEGR